MELASRQVGAVAADLRPASFEKEAVLVGTLHAHSLEEASGHSDRRLSSWPPLPDEALLPRHPVVVLAGGFGSGKTEIAINLCLGLAASGKQVRLIDLDIVKPFFRCREAREVLDLHGVGLIAPPGEQFYSDLPVILPEVKGLIRNPDGVTVIDVGGEAAGSRVLSSLSDSFTPGRYEFLLVVNTSRPFTTDLAGMGRTCAEVRRAAGLQPTGLIANSHLLEETDAETVVEGLEAIVDLGTNLGLPVRMLGCLERLAPKLRELGVTTPVLPLRRVAGLPAGAKARKSPLYHI